MTSKPPVHVEPKDNGWAVIREDSEQAISLHRTQSDAAKEGRELARRERTEYFLHAQDGRVREHRSYEEGPIPAPSDNKEAVDQGTGTAGTVAGGMVDAASRPLGASDVETGETASDEETNEAEEVRGSIDVRQDDTSRTPEEQYASYEAYDRDGLRLGKPDDLFVDEDEKLEYVGFRVDPSGNGSFLVPAEVVTFDDASRHVVVSHPKSMVEAGPSLEQGAELTPGLEERVRRHYGLAGIPGAQNRGAYYREEERAATERVGTAIPSLDAPASPAGRVGGREHDALGDPESGVAEDDKELRVRRSEEELQVGTREYEAGTVRVRKRVRTERERIEVPKKRVEVSVERVPVEEDVVISASGETTSPEITEDEIVVPVIDEEVVVEKRAVVREEIRIRKEVVEETEVVEEDIRREEVEVDDQTERNDR